MSNMDVPMSNTGDDAATVVRPHARYVYNLDLCAYFDESLKSRRPKMLLKVEKIQKKKTVVERTSALAGPAEVSLLPRPEEIESVDSTDPSQLVCIWVGLLPPSYNAANNRTRESKGSSIASLDSVTKLPHDPRTRRVVVPLGKNDVNYYALISQDSETGLCTGLHIAVDEVFFFAEFRDDEATSKANRRQAWPEKIAKAIGRKEIRKSKSRETDANAIVARQRNFGAELLSMGIAYKETGDASYLQSMKAAIERIRRDKNPQAPEGGNRQLVKLSGNYKLDAGMSDIFLSETDCIEASVELHTQWPDLALSATRIGLINRCFVHSKAMPVGLEWSLLRMYILECDSRIDREIYLDEEAGEIGRQAIQHVRLLAGPEHTCRSNVSLDHNTFVAICEAMRNDLTAISNEAKDAVESLAEAMDERVVVATLDQLWYKYGRSPDTDSAKLYGANIHRHNVRKVAQVMDVTVKKLDERAAFWQTTAQNARLAEANAQRELDEDGNDDAL